ncbi:MAG: hypothetical protein IJ719_04475 [Clostridia bacterium]|nr:hypothetical protein [Clostridia bacterium]
MAVKAHIKGTVRIATEHLFKGDPIADPYFVVDACPIGEDHGAAAF